MAYYKDLPIWRDAMRLAVEMEVAVRGFPRYHKYTLGTELRQASHLICQEVAHAALWASLRLQTLQRLVERIEALKISVQLAKELRAFANFAQFERGVEPAVSVGRRSGGWLKRVQGLGHLWIKEQGYVHPDLRGRRVAGLWLPAATCAFAAGASVRGCAQPDQNAVARATRQQQSARPTNLKQE